MALAHKQLSTGLLPTYGLSPLTSKYIVNVSGNKRTNYVTTDGGSILQRSGRDR